jgi:putative DNA primase/helicase
VGSASDAAEHPGGVFNLETGALQPRADLLFTQITGAAPDGRMRTPTWLRFITEIFSTDLAMVEFMQRWIGYCMTGDRREHKLLFWYGTGANGKSVLQSVIQWAMGSYALNLPADVLMRQAHQQHPTELAQLRGKRLALSSELEDNAYWAESRIKSLTGDATLTARFMRQDFFEFPQQQKHVVSGNFKPRLKGDDPAIVRRMVLVPFLERFTGARCDPLLPERLRAELPGILAWAIEGARKWARDGLAIPDKVRSASAEYLAANDDISLWLEDCCAVRPALRAPSAQLYRSYTRWKEAAGERPQSSTAWGARIGQRFDTYRTKHERGYVGVAVLDTVQPSIGFEGDCA